MLKLLLIISLGMTAYALVELQAAAPLVGFVVYAMICTITIGLQARQAGSTPPSLAASLAAS